MLIFLGVPDCIDEPGYKDKHGTTCERTEELGNCADGKPLKFDAEQLNKDRNEQGVSPLDACCACGGGVHKGGK